MKTLKVGPIFYISLCFWLGAARLMAHDAQPLQHLDPEMTGPEYRQLWEELEAAGKTRFLERDDPLVAILDLGKRNLEWIDTINSVRPENQQLQLSTPETTKATPITTHRESSRQIVLQRWADLQEMFSPSFKTVLLGSGSLPTQPTEADAKFLANARAMDEIYQAASRWLLQEPSLDRYAASSYMDIRGYYFLSHEPELSSKLANWQNLSVAQQHRLTPWLISLCRNANETRSQCETKFAERVAQSGTPEGFYRSYWDSAKQVWTSFFRIQNARKDGEFEGVNNFTLPFVDPLDDSIKQWLKENIEDEWRLGAFQLRLRFQPQSQNDHTAHVVFKPGVTPNVNGLGGSRITMDANRNIDSYLERWTIRHEFGHVLGYPDCYIEFYDRDLGVMIYYQIDTENLMCSRRGHLQQQHLWELRRAYGRG